MKKRNRGIVCILVVVLCISSLAVADTIKAETVGKGARIILYDEPGEARFHLGGEIGVTQRIAVEPTGEKTLTDIQFISSDPSVCSVTKEGDFWVLKRLAEGISVIRMACKADGEVVVRTLLVSSYVGVGSEEEVVMGTIKKGATIYYGCTDIEGTTSKTTEVKATTAVDMEAVVAYRCLDFYRVELDDLTFGDSGEEWGYVKKSDVRIPVVDVAGRQEMTFFEGETITLETKVLPEEASDTRVRYQISNSNVAIIGEDGKMTGIHSGSAIVTVTSMENPKLFYKCHITVKPYIPVTGIKVTPHQIVMDDGTTGKIEVKILPLDASVQDFSWHVTGEDVLRIDSKGRYRALKPGKAKVTVISKEGGFVDSCDVLVRPVTATGVYVQSKLDLDVGETKSPVWRMLPVNATNRNVTWRTEDASVAKVDKRGRITGVKTGRTKIRVKTEEGGFTAVCEVTVHIYVDDIKLQRNDLILTVGSKKQLKATVIPNNTTRQKIVWNSKNQSVVSVTQTGKIKALRTGKAEVIVYDRYTGAFDFCLIQVKAGLAKPKLKGKRKKKKYQLSWNKVQRATNYYLYSYNKRKGKFVKYKVLGKKVRKYVISKPKKGSCYKLRAYYAPNQEFSKYSVQVKIR